MHRLKQIFNFFIPKGTRRRKTIAHAKWLITTKTKNAILTTPWRIKINRLLVGVDLARPSIALQINSLDKGGMEEVLAMLANGLRKSGFNVFIFISAGKKGLIENSLRQDGFKVIFLHDNERFLDYLLKKTPIRLCNLHYSTFGLDIYKKHGIKTVYTIHNNYIWDNKYWVKTRKRLYKKITQFIAVSDQVRNAFSRKYNIPMDKIQTIPNGSDITTRKPATISRNDFHLKKADTVFLNVATFSNVKAHILMIAALGNVIKSFPNTKLVFVGNAPDPDHHKKLLDEIKRRKLTDNIVLLDFLPKDKIVSLYDISDCLLMPSLSEGFSMASIEAASRGLPLIMTDIGGARHIVAGGKNGIIISNPYADILDVTPALIHKKYSRAKGFTNLNELIVAMEDLIQNKSAWKAHAKSEIKRIRKDYGAQTMIGNYSRVFRNMIKP